MRFAPVDDSNEHTVDSIEPGDEAEAWVYVNRYWVEVSGKHDDIEAHLIHVDGISEPVGFIAYGQHYADEDLRDPLAGAGELIHLVIDEAKQGKGHGRRATMLAIDRLKRTHERILIAHHPENVVAQRLYESLGFVSFGQNCDGDPLLELAT